MSVEAAGQVLGALQRVESLFAAPDGAPVLPVAPQPAAVAKTARWNGHGHRGQLKGPMQTPRGSRGP